MRDGGVIGPHALGGFGFDADARWGNIQQGGDPKVIDDYRRLPVAPRRLAVAADRGGFVTRLEAEPIGRAAMLLGAGAIGASAVHALWQAYLTTGVLIGIGSGGIGLATGSVIAARWFETRRGLAIGIASGVRTFYLLGQADDDAVALNLGTAPRS